MSPHVFVDETKQRGYLVVAVVVPPTDLARCRKAVRGLILPRQRRIHFSLLTGLRSDTAACCGLRRGGDR